MAIDEVMCETIEYRIVLLCAKSRRLLALNEIEGCRLPRMRIPRYVRPASQLQKEIQIAWGISVFVVDFLNPRSDFPRCAVCQILLPEVTSELNPFELIDISAAELSEQERDQLTSLFSGQSPISASQLGWIDEAIVWLESETSRKCSSKHRMEQLNSGGAFSLVRFFMEDGTEFWLKATGAPNSHEYCITELLSKLAGNFLPQIVAMQPAWNAWIMSGGSTQIHEVPPEPSRALSLLEAASASMAGLQMKTQGRSQELRSAGAFDQRPNVFHKHSQALFEFLEEAMALQTSIKVPLLANSRLREIRVIFEEVCRRAEDLHLPTTIVHGDINCGNILINHGRCQFIDWAEAYIGNPLVSLQHLLLLNKVEEPNLKNFINQEITKKYRTVWLESCTAEAFDQGLIYMPLLAAVSALYGRGDWLASAARSNPRRLAHARTLARYMDRQVREPKLLETLCA